MICVQLLNVDYQKCIFRTLLTPETLSVGPKCIHIEGFLCFPMQVSQKYSSIPPDPTLPPHIYAVANQVYRDMMSEDSPQCCVISGESGAGKTETCKLLVQQLLYLADSKAMDLSIKIEQVWCDGNPLYLVTSLALL